MHEIITLQFGQQANYIGTHYWNTQESYFTYVGQEESPVDHDISFRAGIGANGDETYTPRTLIYDLKGAFGTLRRENALYQLQQEEQPSQRGIWSGATVPLRLSSIAPSGYQQALDQGTNPPRLATDTVRFWSDYNHLFYHPRSIVQLNEYELSSTLMPFEQWSSGEELFVSLDREHDLLDRDLRPFLEECDQLQGLQVLTGIDDAWGGFAAKYLERVSDDLGKGCRWVFGLHDGKRTTRQRQMLQIANVAQSLLAINGSASMHLPMTSLPTPLPAYVSLDAESKWHTSALQAAVMESITLPTRLRRHEAGRASFDMLETTLSNEGNRRVAATGLTVTENKDEAAGVVQSNGHHDIRMTNGHGTAAEDRAEVESPELDINFFPDSTTATSLRSQRRRTHTFSSVTTLRCQLEPTDDSASIEAAYRDRMGEGPRTATYRSHLHFPALSSYPPIFHFPDTAFGIKASVSTNTAVADRIRGIEGIARRSVGIMERESLCDGLVGMAEEYEEGWSDDEDYGEE
ncbi:mtDNA inheritance, partitioning of the mitochondrial organelle [Friedmanniomyces endolithicus]|uniref:MtDNA inheritance, partitioning of the mitochondrial organelle n=1 Tax=Friedmanniomyces endolithicus TaxID=329885 RepID=A0AAN6FZN7_9PEZI|nr:mtDNA inheritance, partitioning of the mitochondrial organelle [Friedmanniomyces endolithicus]KAK0299454.1 mtDNA inheritance, partitioning of the mitochondrial organelle [Friedmanniomyces endolithicus]KAK0326948.1 mtDNA inheritance, partitioning of the mitochondrial organelle [Friedmanniomyces endolithicus]KAK1019217.1 mtDNA inheritance, partitioning of the mitochondrial organelle [Friedmanniomyces endolithicus]